MNTEKLTAVEWLVDQMRQRKEQGLTLSFYDLEMFAQKAKEMEKQEKEKLWTNEEVFDMLYKTDKFLMIELREYWKTIEK